MTDPVVIKRKIGKIAVSKGDYDSSITYQKFNEVCSYGSTFRSKIDNNSVPPQALDADGIPYRINIDKWQLISQGTSLSPNIGNREDISMHQKATTEAILSRTVNFESVEAVINDMTSRRMLIKKGNSSSGYFPISTLGVNTKYFVKVVIPENLPNLIVQVASGVASATIKATICEITKEVTKYTSLWVLITTDDTTGINNLRFSYNNSAGNNIHMPNTTVEVYEYEDIVAKNIKEVYGRTFPNFESSETVINDLISKRTLLYGGNTSSGYLPIKILNAGSEYYVKLTLDFSTSDLIVQTRDDTSTIEEVYRCAKGILANSSLFIPIAPTIGGITHLRFSYTNEAGANTAIPSTAIRVYSYEDNDTKNLKEVAERVNGIDFVPSFIKGYKLSINKPIGDVIDIEADKAVDVNYGYAVIPVKEGDEYYIANISSTPGCFVLTDKNYSIVNNPGINPVLYANVIVEEDGYLIVNNAFINNPNPTVRKNLLFNRQVSTSVKRDLSLSNTIGKCVYTSGDAQKGYHGVSTLAGNDYIITVIPTAYRDDIRMATYSQQGNDYVVEAITDYNLVFDAETGYLRLNYRAKKDGKFIRIYYVNSSGVDTGIGSRVTINKLFDEDFADGVFNQLGASGTRMVSNWISNYIIPLRNLHTGEIALTDENAQREALGGYRYSITELLSTDTKVLVDVKGGSNPRGWGFLDADNKVIQISDDAINGKFSITIPQGAVKLVLNDSRKDANSYIGVIGLVEEVSILKENVAEVKTDTKNLSDDVARLEDNSNTLPTMESLNAVVDVLGINQFKDKLLNIVEPNGYLCWPIIGVFKGKIVCMYTNANQHEATRANPYFMLSSNGVVWNSPKNMVPLQTKRIDITGCGNDSQGNLLAWVRFASFSDHRVMRYDGVSWVEISKPTLTFTGGHISNIFDVDGKLMCFYNAYYASFGVLISEDDGETWTQIEISNGYISTTMPCEISGVYLGDGKILAIARRDGGGQKMLQLQSSDSGAT